MLQLEPKTTTSRQSAILYVDLDHGGSTALEAIQNSDLVPQPNYILITSPEKFQIVWKAEAITLEGAEAPQHAMVREFGGGPGSD
ncbi:MAG: DNA-primase RepB domain-containing protein [Ktedonobacteraceae bacterium]